MDVLKKQIEKYYRKFLIKQDVNITLFLKVIFHLDDLVSLHSPLPLVSSAQSRTPS